LPIGVLPVAVKFGDERYAFIQYGVRFIEFALIGAVVGVHVQDGFEGARQPGRHVTPTFLTHDDSSWSQHCPVHAPH
jgi:hypothetical protein